MKQKIIFIGITILLVSIFNNCAQQSDFPVLKGPYLGQKPPGMTPEVFAPGVISTDSVFEGGATFSSDALTLIYKRAFLSKSGKDQSLKEQIWITEQKNGKWVKPYRAPFDNISTNWDFNFSRDGSKFYFTSRRPATLGGKEAKPGNIWMVEKTVSGWIEPDLLGFPINTVDSYSGFPSFVKNGIVYFHSKRDEGLGDTDIYLARPLNGEYIKVENIGSPVNSKYKDADPCISPDGKYLLFASNRPVDGKEIYDFYISFRNTDDLWTEPKSLGEKLGDIELPSISSDGKYLFFAKPNGESLESTDIYWVDVKFLNKFKPDYLK